MVFEKTDDDFTQLYLVISSPRMISIYDICKTSWCFTNDKVVDLKTNGDSQEC